MKILYVCCTIQNDTSHFVGTWVELSSVALGVKRRSITASVSASANTVRQHGAPILIPRQQMGIANDDKHGASSCNGHIESLRWCYKAHRVAQVRLYQPGTATHCGQYHSHAFLPLELFHWADFRHWSVQFFQQMADFIYLQ